MNLQDLRTELATRAVTADQDSTDLLPGVRQKIRRTKQRRTFAAFGVLAVLVAVAAGLVPSLNATPPPAGTPPEDYTRDGLTVPGTVGDDKLLKAWIGDRDQTALSFSWTPTTNSITIHANCEAGDGLSAIRFTINGWYVGDAGCDAGPNSWTMGSSVNIQPDAAVWLASPVGKPAQVKAELIDLDTRRPAGKSGRIWFGIYSAPQPTTTVNGAPERPAPTGPDDHREAGVTYRQRIGGDTLAAAKVGQREVRFGFTSTGASLVLHSFCTANAGSDTVPQPYRVSMQVGPGRPISTDCAAYSTDAGKGSSLTIASPVPAGQQVDVVARIVPAADTGTAVPADAILGLGVYFQGKQRVIDGTSLPELTEAFGYEYRLAGVTTAAGSAKRVSIATPAGKPYLIAYGSSPLGVAGSVQGELRVGGSTGGIGSGGALGIAWDPHGAGPSEQAVLTISGGTPTKGTLILAVYEPV